jgi:hypothetical protein
MTQKSENGGLPAALLLWVEVLIFNVYPRSSQSQPSSYSSNFLNCAENSGVVNFGAMVSIWPLCPNVGTGNKLSAT